MSSGITGGDASCGSTPVEPLSQPSTPVVDRSGHNEVVSHHLGAVLQARRTVRDFTAEDLVEVVRAVVDDVGLTAVGELAINLSPFGASVGVLLTESHVVVHHWPEYDKITVDIHVCDFDGDNMTRARALAEELERHLTLPQTRTTWHYQRITG